MSKKVIFDVGHPAQVHQFKFLYWELQKRGWKCLFIAKDKDITIDLLQSYSLKHIKLSETKKGLFNKIIKLPKDEYTFYRIVKHFNPDFIIHRFSIHSSHIAKLLRITNIGFADTEHAWILHKLTSPFTDIKFTGDSFYLNLGRNHFRYPGNIELFYLHHELFKAIINPYSILKIDQCARYCIVRFVSWEAHHDIKVKRLTETEKIDLIGFLSLHFKVFISVEGNLPSVLEQFRLKINCEHIHSILQNASFYIGEGASMASEAVCLKTPAIYLNSLPLMGYLKEQSDLGLLIQTLDLELIKRLVLSKPFFDKKKFSDYLMNKINPVKKIIWFLDNYPDSIQSYQNCVDYQN